MSPFWQVDSVFCLKGIRSHDFMSVVLMPKFELFKVCKLVFVNDCEASSRSTMEMMMDMSSRLLFALG